MAFGFSANYFLHFSVFNNKHSLAFTLVFLVMMLLTGGMVMYALSAFTAIVVATLVQHFISNRTIEELPSNGLVIITGTSTGLGRQAALQMVRDNKIHVVATVRKQSDADSLLAEFDKIKTPLSGTLTTAFVDVADDAQIASFREFVSKYILDNNLVFLALYNNAGYAVSTVVEYINREVYDKQFNTNVYGLISITNALLPLIRQHRHATIPPKIVNISSVVGNMSMLNYGIYSASKHCLEGLSDAFRQELIGQDIHVVLIEPGSIATNFTQTLCNQSVLKSSLAKEKEYPLIEPEVHQYYNALISSTEKIVNDNAAAFSTSATVAAETYVHVLKSYHPLPRYLIGRDAHAMLTSLHFFQRSISDVVVPFMVKPLTAFQKKD